MEIYSYEHNTGPSWQSDPTHLISLHATPEAAWDALPKDLKKYEQTGGPDGFNGYKNNCNFPTVKGSELVRLCTANGWWWATFRIEVK